MARNLRNQEIKKLVQHTLEVQNLGVLATFDKANSLSCPLPERSWNGGEVC
jgi:hypothetical protein